MVTGSTKRTDPIRDGIARLSDVDLAHLITYLAFNTKLEQAALHKARSEQRRRRKGTTS
jgi:hypothetical protein